MTPTPGEVYRHDETGEFRRVTCVCETSETVTLVKWKSFGKTNEEFDQLKDFLAWQSHATRVWPNGDETNG